MSKQPSPQNCPCPARCDDQQTCRGDCNRADNNEPGTSKVQDMKRIAVEALGKGEVG